MNQKKRQRLNIQTDGETATVGLDCIEIWDGADLALLREVLTELIAINGFRSIGVDLASVKYIPSGFFGMLYEWYEDGIHIHLHSPQPNVEQMLWFRMFFKRSEVGDYQLCDKEVRNNTPGEQVEYHRREFHDDDEISEDDIDSVRFGVSTSLTADDR